jgi:hypothetical protein
MSGTAEKKGGTPPPHFLKTNAGEPRRRGGQPGNRNAVKCGQHTAQMRTLRAEVRFAVLKAKTLAKAAWAPPFATTDAKRSSKAGISPRPHACGGEGPGVRGSQKSERRIPSHALAASSGF